MSFDRRWRALRRRVARPFTPTRLLGSLSLLVALGVAVWLITLVVSEGAVVPATSSAPPATAPPTTAPPATKTTAPKRATPPGRTPKAPHKPKVVAPGVPLGVYAGPGASVAATTFSVDAGAPVPYAFDFLGGTTWSAIADPRWFLQQWNGSGFRMIWGVPMLPNTGNVSLAGGATGAYNVYFDELGQALVANGQANSVIVLGWDPQDPSLPWYVGNPADAVQYVAYWHEIVTTMRSVPGEQFQFVWDSAPGPAAVLPGQLYPGNSYVDVVATDAFDDDSLVGLGWNAFTTTPYGPDWYATFALRHNKALMIAKWGVVPTNAEGGGDNATFVHQFLHWADVKHLFAAVTWDYGSWAVTGGAFPKAEAALHTIDEASAIAPEAKAVDT